MGRRFSVEWLRRRRVSVEGLVRRGSLEWLPGLVYCQPGGTCCRSLNFTPETRVNVNQPNIKGLVFWIRKTELLHLLSQLQDILVFLASVGFSLSWVGRGFGG